jgi:hypothetical protein
MKKDIIDAVIEAMKEEPDLSRIVLSHVLPDGAIETKNHTFYTELQIRRIKEHLEESFKEYIGKTINSDTQQQMAADTASEIIGIFRTANEGPINTPTVIRNQQEFNDTYAATERNASIMRRLLGGE